MADPARGHATHDPSLVAAAAERGGSLTLQLASCVGCVGLHADLRALALAMPTAALPTRPRDFTLRRADADRLRPGRLRRIVLAIGSPRDALSRPLAIGLTTIGLAGLLVAAVPGALSGSATTETVLSSVPAPVGGAAAPSAAASAAPSYEPMQVGASPVPDLAAGGAGPPVATTDWPSGRGRRRPDVRRRRAVDRTAGPRLGGVRGGRRRVVRHPTRRGHAGHGAMMRMRSRSLRGNHLHGRAV